MATLDEWLTLLHHYDCPQDKDELVRLLALLKGKRSVLEIGSNFGGTLKRMANVLAPGAFLVSVDYPCDDTPEMFMPLESLKASCRKIADEGRRVELFVGNSHARDIVEKVRAFAPFDFVFIDGDHRYEGVKADWEDYGPMGRMVGFHDIAGAVEGCVRLWQEVKASTKFRTEEIVSTGKGFGIGIVYRE